MIGCKVGRLEHVLYRFGKAGRKSGHRGVAPELCQGSRGLGLCVRCLVQIFVPGWRMGGTWVARERREDSNALMAYHLQTL